MELIHCSLVTATWQMREGTQGAIFMCYKQYYGNQALEANMADWAKVMHVNGLQSRWVGLCAE